MHSVLVTTSDTYTVRTDLVRETLPDDWTVEVHNMDAPGIEHGSQEALIDAAVGHDAILLRPGRGTPELFETADSLQVLAVHGSGYDRVDLEAATANDVVVTHSPGGPGPAVVEYTVCAMIALLRDLLDVHERTTAGRWDTAAGTGLELSKRTVGVVGLGTIGLDVARTVSGLGAEVLAYDPYVAGDRTDSRIYPRTSPEGAADAGAELVGFEELLARSDVLSLHCPLTQDTHHLIGAEELEAMAGGYLINVARGGVVDEDALADAVANDTLAGIAIDVMTEEPPDDDNPVLRSSNVLVTPHVAGVTDGYEERGARLGAEKIHAVLTGERPDTVVNPEVYDR